jgi:hypothetical protein
MLFEYFIQELVFMTAKICQTIGTQDQWLYFEECVESLVFETEEVKLCTLERPFPLNG